MALGFDRGKWGDVKGERCAEDGERGIFSHGGTENTEGGGGARRREEMGDRR
jgi:hypothetical protein